MHISRTSLPLRRIGHGHGELALGIDRAADEFRMSGIIAGNRECRDSIGASVDSEEELQLLSARSLYEGDII